MNLDRNNLNAILSWILRTFLSALCAAGGATSALAESFPSRAIEIIVPFPPGGTSDISTRLLAAKWTEFLGQPVIVVNKPGAGSAIGAKYVADAKPDGYTLLSSTDSPMITVRMMQKTGYDLDSFTYLFAYGKGATYFLVRADSPWTKFQDLLDDARQKPMALTYSSYGEGTVGHFSAEMAWRSAGVKLLFIPFKSSSEAVNALIGGHVDVAVIASALGLDKEGSRARVLATMAAERQPRHPNIPTVREFGYPVSLDYLTTIAGPKGLPVEVTKKLLSTYRSAYAKYKDEINAALIRMELVPTELDNEAIRTIWGEREKTFRDMAPSMGLTK
jgi:tripartite-type tricarboxylate transporter receptor subunit TctC